MGGRRKGSIARFSGSIFGSKLFCLVPPAGQCQVGDGRVSQRLAIEVSRRRGSGAIVRFEQSQSCQTRRQILAPSSQITGPCVGVGNMLPFVNLRAVGNFSAVAVCRAASVARPAVSTSPRSR